ncbi:polysaccharide deacetylase family protein [Clostridium kluyveri]|uniref:Polysaccharide deacetylase n=1 Tax=Clostridium kluyveri TaxID=1534 RepID=A0A1L5FCF7_CLOKL|nr:polysaccharide deacetylase family protein [Clostridium kluyveri]APM40692.1 polysaccharide deacetylase [Clostridium kluyveri]
MKKFCGLRCGILIITILFICSNCSSVGYTDNLALSNNKSKNIQECPKEVFLTFDDGPSVNNTGKILKILNDNNIKATFFVVGIKAEENPEALKELSNSGMCIGVHTYSHNYKKIYKSLDAYINDYEICKSTIKKITNKEPINYTRLPGGSTNLIISKTNLNLIKKTLNDKGIKYVDWNVCSGDADSHEVSVEKIKRNVKNQCQNKKIAVILMHDTYYKHFTVESLPEIIAYLKNQGFVFRTFGDLTEVEQKEMIDLEIINKNNVR